MNHKTLFCAAITAIWACSDSATTPPGADAGVTVDGGIDPGTDGGSPVADGGADVALKPWVKPTPFAVPLSVAGPDQLQSAAAGPNGSFYAAGFAAETLTGTKYVTVVKLTDKGLDTTFGVGGVVKTTIACSGGEDEIDIAVQPTGKLVVSTTVPNAVDPTDRDVAVFRLDSAGAIDTTFGVNGIRTIDLNTAIDTTQAAQRDSSRGLALSASGEIFIHALTRGADARTDSDFAVVKLSVDGTVDTGFAGGKFTLDFGTPSANATPRGIHVFADGTVLASGYARSSLTGNTPQVVLYKLSSTGTLVPGFGDNGLFHSVVLTLQTEAYNAVVHGTQIVTAGYGRNAGTTNDWVSLRFDAMTGERDLKWGGAANGAVFFDPSAKALGSNCRNAIALPGSKTLLLGSLGPSNTTPQDAVFAVLDANGVLDKSYGATGINVFPFGAGEGGADQFWGAAVSGSNVLVVGYKGGGATPTDTMNDDAFGVVFPVQ